LLKDSTRNSETGLVIISHQEDAVFSVSDRVYSLDSGLLRLVTTPTAQIIASNNNSSRVSAGLAIETKKLGVRLRKFGHDENILHQVGLKIYQGECLGVIGHSGSGKSSLIRAIAGLVPASGELKLLDLNPLEKKLKASDRKRIGVIFQDSSLSLNPRMTVWRNVAEPLLAHNLVSNRKQARQQAERLLERVRLDLSVAESYPRELSGGQRQRVNIARCLSLNPELVLADEPTSSLDRETEQEILDLLLELRASHSLTLVVVSHEIGVIKKMSDSILVLDSGAPMNRESAKILLKSYGIGDSIRLQNL
jgi:ABC-type glutathione transport system ATPase component